MEPSQILLAPPDEEAQMIGEGKMAATSNVSSYKEHFDTTMNPNGYIQHIGMSAAERTVLLSDPLKASNKKTSKAKKATQATKEKIVKINSFFNNPKTNKINMQGSSSQRNRLFLEGGSTEELEGGGSDKQNNNIQNEPDFVS